MTLTRLPAAHTTARPHDWTVRAFCNCTAAVRLSLDFLCRMSDIQPRFETPLFAGSEMILRYDVRYRPKTDVPMIAELIARRTK
jgi:hypothetical protein